MNDLSKEYYELYADYNELELESTLLTGLLFASLLVNVILIIAFQFA